MAVKSKRPRGSAKLLGIYKGEGAACDDCGRELSARQFRCQGPDGELLVLGRKCAAWATGYPMSRMEHEAAAKERREAFEREVAASWTAEQLAAHYREVLIENHDGTIEVWIDDDPAKGTVTASVDQHAVDVLTRLQAKYAAD